MSTADIFILAVTQKKIYRIWGKVETRLHYHYATNGKWPTLNGKLYSQCGLLLAVYTAVSSLQDKTVGDHVT